jgi:hypothetical protein
MTHLRSNDICDITHMTYVTLWHNELKNDPKAKFDNWGIQQI